jgi:hypothetical protein
MCCRHCDRVDEMTTTIADLRVAVRGVEGDTKALLAGSARIEAGMVNQHEFRPVRSVVYGIVATAGLAVVGGLIRLVLKS